jgi:hypothetical protein
MNLDTIVALLRANGFQPMASPLATEAIAALLDVGYRLDPADDARFFAQHLNYPELRVEVGSMGCSMSWDPRDRWAMEVEVLPKLREAQSRYRALRAREGRTT